MKNRKQPFGYELHMGKVVLSIKEAEVVKAIYYHYLQVRSFQKVAEWLNSQSVWYRDDCATWNKNMVSRILQDTRYLGDGVYQSIISEELFHMVADIIESKRTTVKPEAIKIDLFCEMCGGKIKKNGKGNWSCPNCKIYYKQVDDVKLQQQVRDKLKPYLEEPNRIIDQLESQQIPIIPYLSFEENFDEESAQKAAYEIAEKKYKAVSSNQYETMKIRQCLQEEREPDFTEMKKIIRKLLINREGRISVELSNHQII